MKHPFFAVSLVCAGLLSGTAWAGPQAHQHGDRAAAAPAQGDFAALDRNHDGFIDKAELPKDHPLAPHFGMIDMDRDGKLSPAEYDAGLKMLR